VNVIQRFTTGVTLAHVTPGLPIIDAITFTNETVASCLTAICERVGAYWYLDYANDLHVFFDEGTTANQINDFYPQGASDLTLSEDLSQVVTRVIARGGGGQTAIDVPVGATELPIDDDAWFSAAGGIAEGAAQRITYGSVRGRGGVGALVGTGTTPLAPLSVSGYHGTGLGTGTYQYAETFANATGETLPGPRRTVTLGGTTPPLFAVAIRSTGSNPPPYSGMATGGRYAWRVAVLYTGGAYAFGPQTAHVVVDGNAWEIGLGYPTPDPVTGHTYYSGLTSGGIARIVQIQFYRTVNNGPTFYLERSYVGGTATTSGWFSTADGWTDANIMTNPTFPTGPVAQFNAAVILQPMPAPPAGFTSAHVYRTAVNGAQLKRLVTGINPSVDYVDTTADAALGANAPSADTSGIVTDAGVTVPAGAPSLVVTSTVPFTNDGGASGGWARVGGLVIRYTGISGAELTGIPATGPGALTAAVKYGAQVLVQPRLTGVAGVTRAIAAGEAVTIRVELDDAAAQAALGSRLGGTAADGIVEEVFSDSRMTISELLNYARALLADRKDPWRTLRFVTRDPTVQVGRVLHISITQPPIAGIFRVQKITFDEIAITGGLARSAPRRMVEASNKLYTFADLLRRLRGREGGAG
jgi:hypothetical protein